MLIFFHIQVVVATILLYSTLETPQFFLYQKLCLVDIREGRRNGAEEGQATNCRTQLRSAPGRALINKSCDIWKNTVMEERAGISFPEFSQEICPIV